MKKNTIKNEKSKKIENILYTIPLITFVALNIVDYYSTQEGLKYNYLKEGNPIMKPFVKNPYLFAIVKIGLTAFSCHIMQKLHKKDKKLAWMLSIFNNLLYYYFVSKNLTLINEARR